MTGKLAKFMTSDTPARATPPKGYGLAQYHSGAQTTRLIRAIPVAIIVLSLAFSAVAIYGLWKIDLAESRMTLERLSLAATKQTQWQIDRLEQVMQAGTVWLARMDETENVANLRLQERFQPRLQALEAVESLIISNAEGTLRVITRETVAVPATGFDPRPLFELYRRDPERDLVIGRAFWMPSGKTWAFPFSHRVLDPEGNLVGAITALIRADVIAERFDSIAPSGDFRILLLNSADEILAGRRNEGNSRATEPNAAPIGDGGFYPDWRALPVEGHLAYARTLNDFPLQVVALLPSSAHQARFRGQAVLVVGIAMAAGIGLTAIASLLGMRILAAQKQLREERDFVDRVIDSADAMVLLLDRQGTILRRNAGISKLRNAATIEAARTLAELCAHDHNSRIDDALDRAIFHGHSEFESNLTDANGLPVIISWTISTLPQGASVSGALVCVGADITELRQSWHSLSRNNAIMKHVLAMAKTYYWIGRPTEALDDISGEGMTYSSGASEMNAVPETALHVSTSSLIERVLHPDDQRPYMDGLATFLQGTERRYGYAYRLRRANGGYRHCVGVMEKIQDDSGGIAEIIGVEQDISELSQANALLAENAIKLRRAHRLASLCFMTMDATAPILRLEPNLTGFSDEAANILGHPADHLNEDSRAYLDRVIHPDDRDRFRAEWAAFMESADKGAKFEHRILHGDGVQRHVRVSVEKAYSLARQLAQIVGVIQDVSGQRRREFELLAAKHEAEVANRAKTEFLANMSHELRTPLNAVIGFSQLIRDQNFGPVAERYVGYADDIYRSGEMLLDLINDILDLSRVETGRQELSDDIVCLQDLLQDCGKVLSARAGEGDVRIDITEDTAGIGLRVDQRAIKQVMLNVLSNAVKFTPPGGSVKVSAGLIPGGAVEIRIADTGIGIDPAVIKDLFQPFRQADSQISRHYGGTGLGLAISRSLIRLHDGDIQLESQRGQGTIVRMVLPADRTIPAHFPGRKLA